MLVSYCYLIYSRQPYLQIIWPLVVCEDSLHCIKGAKDNHGRKLNVISVITNNLIESWIIGRVPVKYIAVLVKFLLTPNHRISCCIIVKRLSCGGAYDSAS